MRYTQADATTYHVQPCYMVAVAATQSIALIAIEDIIDRYNWYGTLLHSPAKSKHHCYTQKEESQIFLYIEHMQGLKVATNCAIYSN
jgi:hypothetical protein